VPQERVVTALDLDCIYDAPLAYHKEKLDVSVLAAFRIDDAPKPDLACWERICYNRHHLRDTVRIAIVGKYVQLGDAYISLIEALKHSGISHLTAIDFVWVDSENMNENNLHEILSRCQGIVVPGGFGSRGAEGKIGAAQFARENKIPYLGICLGMQVALIEVARNLAELKSATSQEFVEQNSVERHEFVIRYMQQWLGDCGEVSHRKDAMGKGGTLRLGAYGITLEENSKVASIYGKLEITERHRHRFEVNVDYVEKFQECGVIFSGKSFHGQLPEIIEYADHPWFVGVQFHPELKSRPFAPHPLFLSFVEAALCQRGIENSHK
jgi:CTP synthase